MATHFDEKEICLTFFSSFILLLCSELQNFNYDDFLKKQMSYTLALNVVFMFLLYYARSVS